MNKSTNSKIIVDRDALCVSVKNILLNVILFVIFLALSYNFISEYSTHLFITVISLTSRDMFLALWPASVCRFPVPVVGSSTSQVTWSLAVTS